MSQKAVKRFEDDLMAAEPAEGKLRLELRKLTNSDGWMSATRESSANSSRASTPISHSILKRNKRGRPPKKHKLNKENDNSKRRPGPGRPKSSYKPKKFRMVLEKDDDYEVDYISPDEDDVNSSSSVDGGVLSDSSLTRSDNFSDIQEDLNPIEVNSASSWSEEENETDDEVPSLDLPDSSNDLLLPNDLVLPALSVYEILRHFRNSLRLSPFLFEDFCAALICDETTVLMNECHITLLKSLLKEEEHLGTTFVPIDQKDSYNAGLYFLDYLTWPEVLRAYLESSFEFHNILSIVEEKEFPFVDVSKKIKVLQFLADMFVSSTKIRDELMMDGTIRYDDHCRVCHRLGDLLCCETCPAVYHLACCDPPLEEVPEDEWQCEICLAHKLNGVSNCEMEDEMAGQYLRHDPVGIDRHGRKYWYLVRRLFVESPEEVRYYTTYEEFKHVLSKLDHEKYEMVLCEALKDVLDEFPRQAKITEDLTMEAQLKEGGKTVIEMMKEKTKALVEEEKRKVEELRLAQIQKEKEKLEGNQEEIKQEPMESNDSEIKHEDIKNGESTSDEKASKDAVSADSAVMSKTDATGSNEDSSSQLMNDVSGIASDAESVNVEASAQSLQAPSTIAESKSPLSNVAGDTGVVSVVPVSRVTTGNTPQTSYPTQTITSNPLISHQNFSFPTSNPLTAVSAPTPQPLINNPIKSLHAPLNIKVALTRCDSMLVPSNANKLQTAAPTNTVFKVGQKIQLKHNPSSLPTLKNLFVLSKDGVRTPITIGPDGKLVGGSSKIVMINPSQQVNKVPGGMPQNKLSRELKRLQFTGAGPKMQKLIQLPGLKPVSTPTTGTKPPAVEPPKVEEVKEEPRKPFRLGEDDGYKQYKNYFVENTLALNKYQHKEEKDKDRHVGYKFYMNGPVDFEWPGSLYGVRDEMVHTLRSALFCFEQQIPLCFMHSKWDQYRKMWGRMLIQNDSTKAFGVVLGILEMAIRNHVKKPVWRESLGQVRMRRLTVGEKEAYEKKKKHRAKVEEDIANRNAVWCKYPLPVRSTTVWKLRGEGYRVTGYGGWMWCSSTFKCIHQKASPKSYTYVKDPCNSHDTETKSDDGDAEKSKETSQTPLSDTATALQRNCDVTNDTSTKSEVDLVDEIKQLISSDVTVNVSKHLLKRSVVYNKKWTSSKVDKLLRWRILQEKEKVKSLEVKKVPAVEGGNKSKPKVSPAKVDSTNNKSPEDEVDALIRTSSIKKPDGVSDEQLKTAKSSSNDLDATASSDLGNPEISDDDDGDQSSLNQAEKMDVDECKNSGNITESIENTNSKVKSEESSTTILNSNQVEDVSPPKPTSTLSSPNNTDAEISASKSSVTDSEISAAKSSVTDVEISAGKSSVTDDEISADKSSVTNAEIPADKSSVTDAEISAAKLSVTDEISAAKSSVTDVEISAGKSSVTDDEISADKSSVTNAEIPADKSSVTDAEISAAKSSVTDEISAGKSSVTDDEVSAGKSSVTDDEVSAGKSSVTDDEVSAGKSSVTDDEVSAGKSSVTDDEVSAGKSSVIDDASVSPQTENIVSSPTVANSVITNEKLVNSQSDPASDKLVTDSLSLPGDVEATKMANCVSCVTEGENTLSSSDRKPSSGSSDTVNVTDESSVTTTCHSASIVNIDPKKTASCDAMDVVLNDHEKCEDSGDVSTCTVSKMAVDSLIEETEQTGVKTSCKESENSGETMNDIDVTGTDVDVLSSEKMDEDQSNTPVDVDTVLKDKKHPVIQHSVVTSLNTTTTETISSNLVANNSTKTIKCETVTTTIVSTVQTTTTQVTTHHTSSTKSQEDGGNHKTTAQNHKTDAPDVVVTHSFDSVNKSSLLSFNEQSGEAAASAAAYRISRRFRAEKKGKSVKVHKGSEETVSSCSKKWKLSRSPVDNNNKKKHSDVKMPFPWNFSATKRKRRSIFRLPLYCIKYMASRGGLAWYPQGFRHVQKSPTSLELFWPYRCVRPTIGTAWRYKLQNATTLGSIAHLLRVLWHSMRWDDIVTRPSTDDVIHTVHNDDDIVSVELLKRRDIGNTGLCSEYFARRIVMPTADYDEEIPRSEAYTPSSRSGLRTRGRQMNLRERSKKENISVEPKVETLWLPEDKIELWQIRQFDSMIRMQQKMAARKEAEASALKEKEAKAAAALTAANAVANTSLTVAKKKIQEVPTSITINPASSAAPKQLTISSALLKQASALHRSHAPLNTATPKLIGSPQQLITSGGIPIKLSESSGQSTTGSFQKITIKQPNISAPSIIALKPNTGNLGVTPTSGGTLIQTPSGHTFFRASTGTQFVVQGNKVLQRQLLLKSGSGLVAGEPPGSTIKPKHPTIKLGGVTSLKPTQVSNQSTVESHSKPRLPQTPSTTQTTPARTNMQVRLSASQLGEVLKVGMGTVVNVSVNFADGTPGVGQLQMIAPGAQVTPTAGQQVMQCKVGNETKRFLLTAISKNKASTTTTAAEAPPPPDNEVTLKTPSLRRRLEQLQQRPLDFVKHSGTNVHRLMTDKDPLWGGRAQHVEKTPLAEKTNKKEIVEKQKKRFIQSTENREERQRKNVVQQVMKSILDRIERKEELDARRKRKEEREEQLKRKRESLDVAKSQQRLQSRLLHALVRHEEHIKQDIRRRRTITEKYLTRMIENELHEDRMKLKRKKSTNASTGGQNTPVAAKHPRKSNYITTDSAISNILTESNKRKLPKQSPKKQEKAMKREREEQTPEQEPPSKRKKKMINSSVKLYCICKTPYDDTRFYIGCDLCMNWFHGECVGISEKKAKHMETWICHECDKEQSVPQQELYCLCKTPYDDSQFYIGCDVCQDWYHGECVGVSEDEAASIESYTCPRCKQQARDASNEKPLTDREMNQLIRIIKHLQHHKMAWPFLEPVREADAPGYYKVVKRPMDLQTVMKRLQCRFYMKLSELVGDVSLIFDNCRQYNGADSKIVRCAEFVETVFVGKIRDMRGR